MRWASPWNVGGTLHTSSFSRTHDMRNRARAKPMPAPKPSVRLAKGPLPLSALLERNREDDAVGHYQDKVYAKFLEQVGVDFSENGVHCLNKNSHCPYKYNDFKKVQVQGLQHV